jgi:predicted phage replisome organizer
MAKKYYWLKLKSDFFTSRAMKKLRKIAGGDTYTIIYLKLQLLSLKDEGLLYYEGVEPTFSEEMALALDEDADNVKATLIFLENMGLISQKNEHEYILNEVPYLIGGESESAERVRRFRQKNLLEVTLTKDTKTLQCNAEVTESNGAVTKSNTEIEIDKDIDKEKSKRESKSEKSKAKRFTPPTLEEVTAYCIERNNNIDAQHFIDYYTSNGWLVGKNKMKDWKAAVRTWERNNYSNSGTTKGTKGTKAQELDSFYNMASEWAESEG